MSTCPGVKSIDTNVEAKTVIVDADPSVTPQLMLEKLEKVSVASDLFGRARHSLITDTSVRYDCSGVKQVENWLN